MSSFFVLYKASHKLILLYDKLKIFRVTREKIFATLIAVFLFTPVLNLILFPSGYTGYAGGNFRPIFGQPFTFLGISDGKWETDLYYHGIYHLTGFELAFLRISANLSVWYIVSSVLFWLYYKSRKR